MAITKGGSPPTSSSSPSDGDLVRVLRAFEQSPVTTGKAKFSDHETAHKLLSRYTAEQVENGILLASARRSASAAWAVSSGEDKRDLRVRVQNLSYFVNAIAEVAEDPSFGPSYADYLRHVLRQIQKGEIVEPRTI